MNELLVICPTRNRIEILKKFLQSYIETIDRSMDTDLILAVDVDDDNEYKSLSLEYGFMACLFEPHQITHAINTIFKAYELRSKAYMVVNDDFEFKTPGWNKTLFDKSMKNKIAYPRDGNLDGRVPTTFVVPQKIACAVGYLQMPTLTHLYGDMVWQALIKECKIDGYCPNVLIEHNHFIYGKSEIDETYKRTNSKEMYSKDQSAFREWLQKDFKDDAERIKLAVQ